MDMAPLENMTLSWYHGTYRQTHWAEAKREHDSSLLFYKSLKTSHKEVTSPARRQSMIVQLAL